MNWKFCPDRVSASIASSGGLAMKMQLLKTFRRGVRCHIPSRRRDAWGGMRSVGKEAVKISDPLCTTIVRPTGCLYLSFVQVLPFGEILSKSFSSCVTPSEYLAVFIVSSG